MTFTIGRFDLNLSAWFRRKHVAFGLNVSYDWSYNIKSFEITVDLPYVSFGLDVEENK